MVHALGEIRRILKPNGILLDLRPLENNWSVEVGASANWHTSGRLNALPAALEDDKAALKAMREAEANGWYIKGKEKEFDFFYYWDMPSEMKEFMESEWGDFKKLDENVYRKTNSLWVSAGADARVRVRVKILVACWNKL